MRVSTKQMHNVVNGFIAKNSKMLLKAQERVATRKLINRPSDDPAGIGRVLDYRKTMSSIDQYLRNITIAKTRVDFTVTNLGEVDDLLHDARDLAVTHSSSEATDRETAAQQIGDIYDRILDIANTKLGGDYLFAGHKTGTRPFPLNEVTTGAESTLNGGESFNISSSSTDYYVWYDIDNGSTDPNVGGRTAIEVDIASGDTPAQVAAKTANAIDALADFSASQSGSRVTISSGGIPTDAADNDTEFFFHSPTYSGDNKRTSVIAGSGMTVRVNAHGNEVFTGSGVTNGADIFSVLRDLKEGLENDDTTAIVNQVDELTNAINQVERVMSKQSATFQRLESTEGHWKEFKENIEDMLSSTEDADLALAIVELQTQQTAYEASLSAAANMFRQSLLDFLG